MLFSNPCLSMINFQTHQKSTLVLDNLSSGQDNGVEINNSEEAENRIFVLSFPCKTFHIMGEFKKEVINSVFQPSPGVNILTNLSVLYESLFPYFCPWYALKTLFFKILHILNAPDLGKIFGRKERLNNLICTVLELWNGPHNIFLIFHKI